MVVIAQQKASQSTRFADVIRENLTSVRGDGGPMQ